MIVQPSQAEFLELAADRRVISVYAKLLADDLTACAGLWRAGRLE